MRTLCLLTGAMTAGLDLGVKKYVEENLGPGEERRIWKGHGFFRRVHNHGMMLNSLEKYPKLVKMTSVLACGMLWVWEGILLKKPGYKAAKIGTALMAGGAAGNTYDRIKRGYVVDYLGFKTKNKKLTDITFNLSDFALFGGAILTIWSTLLGTKN